MPINSNPKSYCSNNDKSNKQLHFSNVINGNGNNIHNNNPNPHTTSIKTNASMITNIDLNSTVRTMKASIRGSSESLLTSSFDENSYAPNISVKEVAISKFREFKTYFENLEVMDPSLRILFFGQLDFIEAATCSFPSEYFNVSKKNMESIASNPVAECHSNQITEYSAEKVTSKPAIYIKKMESDLSTNEITDRVENKGVIAYNKKYKLYCCLSCGTGLENIEKHFSKCEFSHQHNSPPTQTIEEGKTKGKKPGTSYVTTRKSDSRITQALSSMNENMGQPSFIQVDSTTQASQFSTLEWKHVNDFQIYWDSNSALQSSIPLEPVEGISIGIDGIQCLSALDSSNNDVDMNICYKVFATKVSWEAHMKAGPKANGHKFKKYSPDQKVYQNIKYYQQVFENNKYKKLIPVEISTTEMEYVTLPKPVTNQTLDLIMAHFHADSRPDCGQYTKSSTTNSTKLAPNMNCLFNSLQELDKTYGGFIGYLDKLLKETHVESVETVQELCFHTISTLQNMTFKNNIFKALSGKFG